MIQHVERADEARALVIAPATANVIAKLAAGLADDVLTAVALSTRAPIFLAPAMEHHMWHHPATQDNLAKLIQRGVRCIGPTAGSLASGRSGDGRMAEPAAIVRAVIDSLKGDLRHQRVTVTAGPTWEPIDPVRVVTNRSTGAMGIALAEEAALRGAKVRLVLGPTHLRPRSFPDLVCVRVETAQAMLSAALEGIEEATAVIGSAAVSDYRPQDPSERKLKKNYRKGETESTQLLLVPNPDIIQTLADKAVQAKKVGFAAETENVVDNARSKLRRKGLDWVVGNLVGPDRGFGTKDSQIVMVSEDSEAWSAPGPKADLARYILDVVFGASG